MTRPDSEIFTKKRWLSKLNNGTTDKYWDMMTEIGAPIVAVLSKADEAMRQKIKTEVFELVNQHYPGEVAIDARAGRDQRREISEGFL